MLVAATRETVTLRKFMNPTAPDEPKFVKLEMEVVEMEAQPQEAQQAQHRFAGISAVNTLMFNCKIQAFRLQSCMSLRVGRSGAECREVDLEIPEARTDRILWPTHCSALPTDPGKAGTSLN